MLHHEIIEFDRWLFVLINTGLARRWLDAPMLELTALGSWPIALVAIGVLSAAGRRQFWRGHAAAMALVLAVGIPLNAQVKQWVNRARPATALTQRVERGEISVRVLEYPRLTSRSFPSGHAMTAFFFMTYVALYRRSARFWAWLLAALVALSRVYVGLHFPFDCLAGAALGATGGWTAWLIYRRWLLPLLAVPDGGDGGRAAA